MHVWRVSASLGFSIDSLPWRVKSSTISPRWRYDNLLMSIGLIMTTQRVGPHFELALMQQAQQRGLEGLAEIARRITVGMTEEQAVTMALDVLHALGAETHWHPPIIRFGANTCKIYSEASDPAIELQANDLFFIDLGPVFQGHEADIGATFTVGDAPEHQACAAAVAEIFQRVSSHWQRDRKSVV